MYVYICVCVRVSESEHCKMPVNNLAKVFGPTCVGYSTQEPEPMQMINETRKQQLVGKHAHIHAIANYMLF